MPSFFLSDHLLSHRKLAFSSRTPESLLWITTAFIQSTLQFWLNSLFSHVPSACLLKPQLTAQWGTCSSRRSQPMNCPGSRSSRCTVSWGSNSDCRQVPAAPSHLFTCWSLRSYILSIILSLHALLSRLKPDSLSSASLGPPESWVFSRSWVPLSFHTRLLASQLPEFQLDNFLGLCPQTFPALSSFWKQYPN